jgi:oligoribonuclease
MKLVWINLKTTGISPAYNEIVEVAVVVTDYVTPFDLDTTVTPDLVFQTVVRCESWGRVDPFIIDMHGKSGLIVESLKTRTELRQAENQIIAALAKAGIEQPTVGTLSDRPVLAGSSVYFDCAFLARHMPTLDNMLSHRHLDVSSLKIFAEALGMPKLAKAEAHRAGADIQESITHARACLRWLHDNGFQRPVV